MARSLVIVESPAKAKTINKYLGRDYTVKASLGHVMDLPKKTLGVLLPGEENSKRKKKAKSKARGKAAEKSLKRQPVSDDNIFEPKLEIIPGKKKIIEDLRSAASDAPAVYLAGDPDREGEAICAHLAQVLSKPKRFVIPEDEEKKTAEAQDGDKKTPEAKKKTKKVEFRAVDPKKIFRVTFNEITPKAIRAAFEKPGQVDTNLVEAQQARRVLDRLVGYKISPLLWDKVRRGLSAGRVQSVALKMIADREEDIKAFVPVEYWTFAAKLAAVNPPPFIAKLSKIEGKKAEVSNGDQAKAIDAALRSGKFVVETIARKEKKQSPGPPLITSTLQRAAYNRFKYPVKRTMSIAQKLYEGKELGEYGFVGLITYMRTDSVRISDEAIGEVRQYIGARYGADILPEKANVYRVKKAAQAQEAHEAIRPTSVELDPEKVSRFLTKEEYNLYKLIFERFVASQMKPALFDVTDVDIANGRHTLRASGEVLKFAGFLAAFQGIPE